MSDLLDRLSVVEARAGQLEERLADPQIASSPTEYAVIAKELSQLRPPAEAAARFRRVLSEIHDAKAMLSDSDGEMRSLAEVELSELESQRDSLERPASDQLDQG